MYVLVSNYVVFKFFLLISLLQRKRVQIPQGYQPALNAQKLYYDRHKRFTKRY